MVLGGGGGQDGGEVGKTTLAGAGAREPAHQR